MYKFKSWFNKTTQYAMKLTKMRFFNEIYATILAGVTLLGWFTQNNVGMILLICFGLIALILLQDLKYVIPNVIFFIFTFSSGFENDKIPIHIILLATIFIVIVMIFSFRKGFKIKKMKSLIGLLGLAVTTLLPFCWMHNAESGNEVFYFFYIADLGYLLIYILMVNGIREKSIDILAITMSYLGILIAVQCGYTVWKARDEFDNILQYWFHLGWGLCNEAGIMFCVTLPFMFYLMGKQEKLPGMIFQHFKILIALVGLVLTNSRGAYLFGAVEIAILYLILFWKAKNARLYQNFFFVFCLLVLVAMVCCKDLMIKIIDDVLEYVFGNKLDDNGRTELWETAYDYWQKNPLYKLLGPGITCDLKELSSGVGIQLMPAVFHSTFFETLATGGMVGFAFLLWHFYQKYSNLYQCDKLLFLTIGIGYLCVDAYGLLDNTYHMYYFMIPLAVSLAVIDASLPYEPIELRLC